VAKPLLRRDTSRFPDFPEALPERLLVSRQFSVQWHVTNACDLHCRHCYDRSRRDPLTLEQGLRFLDDLRSFCAGRGVAGTVAFSGGNPFLSPHFLAFYAHAVEAGLFVSVLGNPVPPSRLDALLAIQRPELYQISLEGLEGHNDAIRGPGSFARALRFLRLLRARKVPSGVMLTLTADNLGQVLPLATLLRGRTDDFTFCRLSRVGEGARLRLPSKARYAAFLVDYLAAARENPILSLKDNLFNILLYRSGRTLFRGCIGFGCSPAFNSVAVLPDGEVHACRKFPSPIGDVTTRSLGQIYDSRVARRYRRGSSACRRCLIKPLCGGCMAAVRGAGLDVFRDRDPYCFM
jgi:selenobiotic family peptide radical SAM maturase